MRIQAPVPRDTYRELVARAKANRRRVMDEAGLAIQRGLNVELEANAGEKHGLRANQ